MGCIFSVQKYIGFPGGMSAFQTTIQEFIKPTVAGDRGHGIFTVFIHEIIALKAEKKVQ